MHQSPITPSEIYGRQLLHRIVPILGTCYLVYWLSGGIPPTSWQQLVQVCGHFTTLLASKGAGAFTTLFVLFAQALCIGFAWGFLLWLMVREFRALRSGISPLSEIDGQRSASLTQSAQKLFPSSSTHVAEQMSTPDVQPYQAPSLGVGHWQAPPMQTSSALFDNPFADETQRSPLTAQHDYVRASYVPTPQEIDPNKQAAQAHYPLVTLLDEDSVRPQEQQVPSRTRPSKQVSPPLSALSMSLPMESALPPVQLADISTPFDTQESGELERLQSINPGSDEIHYSDMLGTLGFIPARVQSSRDEEKKVVKPVEPIQMRSELPTQPPVPTPKEQTTTKLPERQPQAAVPPAPKTPAPSPASTPANNPFDVQSDVFDLFRLGSAPNEPIFQPAAPQTGVPMRDSTPPFVDNPGSNPFEDLALPEPQPSSTSLVRVSHANVPQPAPIEEDDEEDDPFIFGNPFEGPLPDVFHQDSDLRQSVLEHTGNVIEAPVEQTRAKKKRPKKRFTPTQQP